jgi:amidohydrolase
MITDPLTENVLAGLDRIRPWQEDLYRSLHENPELSGQEIHTAATVAERLRSFGFDVHDRVGGTGVVGVLRNGGGPTVLLRAEIDALPIKERTGLPYASSVTATDQDGHEVPVMHACGHDLHITCLLGAASLLAASPEHWNGTVVALFQPSEELGTGADEMVSDKLAKIVDKVDVALAQHVLPFPAGLVATRPGTVFAIADSVKITVHGRGSHGSMPQFSVDPVVLAAMIVVRLQTVVAREVAPAESAVLTVGSIQSGSKSNVIGDHAVMELNVRSYNEQTRSSILSAIRRIVTAECQASGAPKEPDIELFGHFPLTANDRSTTERVRMAFDEYFGDRSGDLAVQAASEDFSAIADAFSAPYSYWGIGSIDPDIYRKAKDADRVAQDIPVNHSDLYAPAMQPTLDTGTQALVVAALAWLDPLSLPSTDGAGSSVLSHGDLATVRN